MTGASDDGASYDEEAVARVREALAQSDRVDDSEIEVLGRGGTVILRGAVSSAEEASAAGLLAEEHADDVVNELRSDPDLLMSEDSTDWSLDGEETAPEEDEVLVGSTDMLSGELGGMTSDMDEAFGENEPWDPPDEPHLAPTAAEQHGGYAAGEQPGFTDPGESWSRDPSDDAIESLRDGDRPSAPDLSAADLVNAGSGHDLPGPPDGGGTPGEDEAWAPGDAPPPSRDAPVDRVVAADELEAPR